ncbi:hypothetical protein NL676_012725 [Syzygium grande]|nr:hypothetical protein NL676_012725 [Syzygium grande]
MTPSHSSVLCDKKRSPKTEFEEAIMKLTTHRPNERKGGPKLNKWHCHHLLSQPAIAEVPVKPRQSCAAMVGRHEKTMSSNENE